MSWIEIPQNEIVDSFNLSKIEIDEAYLNYSSSASNDLWLYRLSTNCIKCPYTLASDVIQIAKNHIEIVKTTFLTKYRLRTSGIDEFVPEENDNFKFCDLNHEFGEFGVYNWHASGSSQSPNCIFEIVAEPVNIYLPLALAVMFYVFLLTICYNVGSLLVKFSEKSKPLQAESSNGISNEAFRPSMSPSTTVRFDKPNGENRHSESPSGDDTGKLVPPSPNASQNENTPVVHTPVSSPASRPLQSKQRQRLQSLDTFRGISIVIMIFVNDGGGKYYFFEHATWDGLYVADLVFPWFLWIMGVCIPVAIKSQVKKEVPKLKIFTNIAIRSAKLIALGLLLNSTWSTTQFGTGANLRIPGILQRFGVCYFVCATLVLVFMPVNITKPPAGGKFSQLLAAFQDIGVIWISWIIVLLILLSHCLITFLLPVEGCQKGYLGPGGLHNNNAINGTCIGGAAGYLDREIFTLKHIYQYPTSKSVYGSIAYDPEGFLGSLTSIFQVWTGVQAGVTMLAYPRPSSRLIRWGTWAVLTGGIGALLCGGSQTGWWIPINKNLWSVSFVFVTTSFAFTLLSFLYIIIDIKKWWTGSPFHEPGMNSILLYVGHNILRTALPWHWKTSRMETHFMQLTEALWGTSVWVLIAIWLHHKKKYWTL